MNEFGQWLVEDYHWMYVIMALFTVWFLFLDDIVDKFLSHRRKIKEVELNIQLSREAEARERNKNRGLHFD